MDAGIMDADIVFVIFYSDITCKILSMFVMEML
jgi:hypothetical protein